MDTTVGHHAHRTATGDEEGIETTLYRSDYILLEKHILCIPPRNDGVSRLFACPPQLQLVPMHFYVPEGFLTNIA